MLEFAVFHLCGTGCIFPIRSRHQHCWSETFRGFAEALVSGLLWFTEIVAILTSGSDLISLLDDRASRSPEMLMAMPLFDGACCVLVDSMLS